MLVGAIVGNAVGARVILGESVGIFVGRNVGKGDGDLVGKLVVVGVVVVGVGTEKLPLKSARPAPNSLLFARKPSLSLAGLDKTTAHQKVV